MLELPPKLGFYVEIVVFFAFAWIMIPLILRPTLEVLARRAEKTSGAQAEALAMRDEVTAMGEAFEKSLNDARLAGASGGDQIRREAEASERQMLDAARKDALQTLESIRAEIASETDEARNSLNSQSNDLAKVAANKILGRQVSA
ncbi:MAG: ATP synthase F0 subunit B [Candidatus Binatia bacterium]|jgi:F-type H+-transporting ATPase subunit b|nr:ATP synthase F0 subunit B [Candidatus Binatia bacterium]MDG2010458.1 ATP synthase F0 subunit B [Candidatus Binatia bacterium]HAC80290.1 hypothetical protein [Deltaproteobacteria bacterium]|tara:strand:+ start:49 stop:486 length:438 start_codon:yes stop_codon:yes gene_type:complete